jgi:hypothetical protein
MPSEHAVEEVPDSEDERLESEHQQQEPDLAGHLAARHVVKQLGIAGSRRDALRRGMVPG